MSKLTIKSPGESQCFITFPCKWGRSGGYSCIWICFNIYLLIIYFIWQTARYTIRRGHVLLFVPRSTQLRGAQRFPELAFRSTDFLSCTWKPNFTSPFHHMVLIYDTHLQNDNIPRRLFLFSFFHFIKILIFHVLKGERGYKMRKSFACCAPYLRNQKSCDRHLW